MDQDQTESERQGARRGEAWRKARIRINSYKTEVATCQRARDEAVAMLEIFAERMAAMVDSGEIGRRLGVDGQSYPQLRIIYWGEIDSGSMNLLCIEADYGGSDKARIGVWAKLRSMWDCSALEGPWARFNAWRKGFSLGQAESAESTWSEVCACLRALSMDLELDLDFGPTKAALDAPVHKADDKAWGDWLSAEGSAITMFPALPAPEAEPSEVEWLLLEARAKSILAGFKRHSQGSDSGELPPKGPSQGGI